ncbi:MAG TPA: heterodisulfide reductase-related iron-sulfur binding cluster [Acidimicrobiales bacterium]|nr:heterodisulfide reductase-related iron-sulfur binding cluster [Acidimicrobiales bacterium]
MTISKAVGLGSFDEHDPPSRELVDDCVHCGFCLSTCPTFVLWGEEMDSPRGRIYLMRAALDGAPINDSMVGHFDNCLGCMSCLSACPSNVQYDQLIGATRGQIERQYHRPWQERLKRSLIFALFPYPKRLRVVRVFLRLYQRSGMQRVVRHLGLLNFAPPFLRTMESIAPTIGKRSFIPERSAASGVNRGSVGLLTGCVQGAFFPKVNEATVRVLNAEGFDVVAPKNQGCCGALSAHTGRLREARSFAKRLIDTFERAGVTTVIVNSAGCGSSMKEYPHLLAGDRRYQQRAEYFARNTKDIAEFLAEIEPLAVRHPLDIQIAYHDACHLGHAQRIKDQPRKVLGQIPGIYLKDIADGEICCGSAGVYNIFQPVPARELGLRKAAQVALTGASLLVAANPGCTMQIATALEARGTPLPVAHTIELVDASIRNLGVGAFLNGLPEERSPSAL